jgi:type II secretory pathway pseudopilin PulG
VLIIALVVGGLLVFCMCSGIAAAIAIPNFIRFHARAKQAECKTNLKALYVAQQSYFAEKNDFADDATDVGFAPAGKTRYTYFGGPDLVIEADSPESKPVEEADLPPLASESLPGVEGECPDCTFTAACAGNIDTDDTLDVWSISSGAREHQGQTIAPGELFHDVDDLSE